MKEARAIKGVTQKELGIEGHISRSYVNEIEAERKRVPKDVAPKLAEVLDCGFFNMELANHFTGGSWVGKLDGDRICLNPSSMAIKTNREGNEMIETINNVIFKIITIPPESITKEEEQELETSLYEVMDSIVIANHFLASTTRDYGISWKRLWGGWRTHAEEEGIINKNKKISKCD